jgi:hypothetical protein
MRAHGLTVRGDVKLNDMCVHGSIELASARIAGDLKISRTKIEDHGDDTAIHADRAVITGSMYARWLEVHKTIRLVGARVEGDLNFDFASFHGDDALSVNARNLHVSGSLFWRGLEKPPTGAVRMLHAVVGRLADDAESWPRADQLILDGFVYGGFGPESPQSAAERLHWLALQPSDGFRAQPYEQLAKVFRSMGREVDARRVLIAKQEVHRTRAVLNRRTRAWLWFLGKSIRYGYEPWRVISFMVAMVLVGWGVFSLADIESSGQFQSDFNAFVYSLDVFVPIVDLHQENRYLPSGSGPAGPWFRGYFWLHIILGWVSSTLLVAAFTGLIRRE